jgi:hypothetical protein
MGDQDDELFMGGGKSTSFIGHLTTITPVEKNELLNVFQYILISIIPLVLFLKFMKEYIPPENPTKSTIEITTEVVIQLFLIFFVFWMIHKIVIYIPTYSNTPYDKLNMVQLVLPVLFLLLCMKSSISEKMSILLDRALILLGLRTEGMEEEPKQSSRANTNQPNAMGCMPPGIPQVMSPMDNPMNTSRSMDSRDYDKPRQLPNMNQNMEFGIQEPVAANAGLGTPW